MISIRGGAPQMGDVIVAGIEDRLRDLHTSMPGEVMEYDAERQTATVRPMLGLVIPDDEGALILEYPPDIYDVPVVFSRSRGGGMTLPFGVGDTVQLLFNQRDIGQWRATNVRGSPGDHRICSMAGAVAIVGLYADVNTLDMHDTQNVVIYANDGVLVKLGSAEAEDPIALAPKVDAGMQMFADLLSGVQVLDPTTGVAIPGALWLTSGTLADAGALKTAAAAMVSHILSTASTKVLGI